MDGCPWKVRKGTLVDLKSVSPKIRVGMKKNRLWGNFPSEKNDPNNDPCGSDQKIHVAGETSEVRRQNSKGEGKAKTPNMERNKPCHFPFSFRFYWFIFIRRSIHEIWEPLRSFWEAKFSKEMPTFHFLDTNSRHTAWWSAPIQTVASQPRGKTAGFARGNLERENDRATTSIGNVSLRILNDPLNPDYWKLHTNIWNTESLRWCLLAVIFLPVPLHSSCSLVFSPATCSHWIG